ncbi:LOW QUALITY PROTEIN: dihydrolipoamide succinyltransferase component of 2-oxoglutarate dehydrogenase complex [Geomicrobium sp. JCM 19037]|nr:LOW QUALITY PROTEIN: dihydrolipoamide succinyltransferase component of 2-oxoglutarate dehydrogenase complex [Geomicrobium sp. JCM 19037]
MAEIKVPELAESITEGTIAEWLKQPGDYIEQGETIAELETDKVNVEINSEQSGVLQKHLREAGDTVEIGEAIATIDENAKEGSAPAEEPAKESPAAEQPSEKKEEPSSTGGDDSSESSETDHVIASPAARKLAREKGINLNEISTRDPLGRVRKEDVEAHTNQPKSAPAAKNESPAPEKKDEFGGKPHERIKMSRRRQTIAKRLVDVQQESAMLTTFNEVDMSAIMDIRKRRKDAFQEQHDGVRLGFMSFLYESVVGALKKFPLLNAEIQGNEIVKKDFYDIGMAVSTNDGLVVPVVRDAERLSFAGIEKEIGELGKKARDNKLALSDLQGGTFTITNGGVFGSLLSTPILNAPQVGILGMHTIQWRPVAIDQERMENRPMMYIALSYDHRIVDGKEAVSFLVELKKMLEEPEQLLLEG